MRTIIQLLILAIFSLSLSVQASISLPLKDGSTIELYDKSYALLIGVSDYAHWPDLPGVEEDIELVGQALKQHGFKVISLLNPTRASFDTTMRNFIGDYGQDPENRLIIYYAGHGYTLTTNRGRELGYIVPSDTPLPQDGTGNFKKKAISMPEIEIFAKQMESKHALFTFDSCFSGSLFEITRAVPDSISLKTSEPVRQFITAGSAEQTVPDKSVFRRQFIAGLEGDADVNKDGFITGTELAQFIEESVTNYTRRAQTPQYGKIRDPYLDKGDFVFINPKMEITINVPGGKSQGVSASNIDAVELSYWDTINTSNDPETLQAYLDEYPDGKFSKLATLLIKKSGKQAERDRELRLQREGELNRQQALFAEQRRKNEQHMVELKIAQAKLSLQQEQQDVLLKEDRNYSIEKQSIRKRSFAILTWPGNLQDDHHFEKLMTNKKFAGKMANTIANSLDKELGVKNTYTKILDRDRANVVIFEGDNFDASKQVCEEHSVDKAVTVRFSRSSLNGEAEIHLYDCISENKKVEMVDLSTTVGENYYLEYSLEKALRTFYEYNIELLTSPN